MRSIRRATSERSRTVLRSGQVHAGQPSPPASRGPMFRAKCPTVGELDNNLRLLVGNPRDTAHSEAVPGQLRAERFKIRFSKRHRHAPLHEFEHVEEGAVKTPRLIRPDA